MNTYNRLTPGLALQLAAPHTWPASVCPVLFGELYCAVRGMHLSIFQDAAILIACILMQSSVNTLNDYIDYLHGTDSADDNVEVNDAVLVYANVNPKHTLFLGIAYLAVGALLGILACTAAGIVPVMIGVAGGLTVVLYSAGPIPVSYLPVGEFVSGFVMGGLIPLGTAAVSDGRIHIEVLFWALPLMLSIALIMMSNNGSDIEKDVRSGRRCLPTYLGRERTRMLYHLLVIIWAAMLCVLPVLLLGTAGLLSVVLLAIFARKKIVYLVRADLEPEGRIKLMKTITAANLSGNGAYIITLAFGLCLKGLTR